MDKKFNSKVLGDIIKEKILDSIGNKPVETDERLNEKKDKEKNSGELGDILKEKILDSINDKSVDTSHRLKEER